MAPQEGVSDGRQALRPMPDSRRPATVPCSSGTSTPCASSSLSPSSPASPGPRGALSKDYEGRFGTPLFKENVPYTPCTPRTGKKPGLTTFTDPMNPFARTPSKAMTKIEDARNDAGRAGARTRNPGVIPAETAAERQRGDDRLHRLVPHRYGNHEWHPSKRCPDSTPNSFTSIHKSPRSSEGVAAALTTEPQLCQPGLSALENYLNDMKRGRHSRRALDGTPSAALQRINNMRAQLPADREFPSRARSHSVNRQAESDQEDTYGFPRKRPVSGRWAQHSSQNLLQHTESPREPGSLRCSDRQQQADARFVEMVQHMKASIPGQRQQFELYKVRSKSSKDLLAG